MILTRLLLSPNRLWEGRAHQHEHARLLKHSVSPLDGEEIAFSDEILPSDRLYENERPPCRDTCRGHHVCPCPYPDCNRWTPACGRVPCCEGGIPASVVVVRHLVGLCAPYFSATSSSAAVGGRLSNPVHHPVLSAACERRIPGHGSPRADA